MVEWQSVIQWGLGLLGTGIITGLAYVLRTLGKQNELLAVLVSQVGGVNIPGLETRVRDLEITVDKLADGQGKQAEVTSGLLSKVTECEKNIQRMWGIYDAWRLGTTNIPAQHPITTGADQ